MYDNNWMLVMTERYSNLKHEWTRGLFSPNALQTQYMLTKTSWSKRMLKFHFSPLGALWPTFWSKAQFSEVLATSTSLKKYLLSLEKLWILKPFIVKVIGAYHYRIKWRKLTFFINIAKKIINIVWRLFPFFLFSFY